MTWWCYFACIMYQVISMSNVVYGRKEDKVIINKPESLMMNACSKKNLSTWKLPHVPSKNKKKSNKTEMIWDNVEFLLT